MRVGIYQSDGTCWRRANGVNVVTALQGLCRHHSAASTEVRKDVTARRHGGGDLTIFQGPLLFGLVDNPKIVNTGVGLGSLPRTHEIGDSDCRQ